MIIHVNNITDDRLQIYNNRSESELMHCYEPNPGVFIAESKLVIERALDAGYEPLSMLVEDAVVDGLMDFIDSRLGGIDVYVAPLEALEEIIGYKLTRGVLCAMRRKELPRVEDICCNARRIAILEEVMNPTNVGAIFRSAAALSIDAVILTKGCSDPLYRRSVRVSMGNVFLVDWTFIDENCSWPEEGMKLLTQMGFKTVAMALCDDSVPIDDERLAREEKLAIILGTEGEGLRNITIEGCDYTAKIPMTKGVDSLNVAAASAVAFWQLAGNRHD